MYMAVKHLIVTFLRVISLWRWQFRSWNFLAFLRHLPFDKLVHLPATPAQTWHTVQVGRQSTLYVEKEKGTLCQNRSPIAPQTTAVFPPAFTNKTFILCKYVEKLQSYFSAHLYQILLIHLKKFIRCHFWQVEKMSG